MDHAHSSIPFLPRTADPYHFTPFTNGKPEHHPEGCYFVRCAGPGGKRVWENVGTDWQLALDAQRRKAKALDAEAAGVEVVHDTYKHRLADKISSPSPDQET
jgi:hypothetical protein